MMEDASMISSSARRLIIEKARQDHKDVKVAWIDFCNAMDIVGKAATLVSYSVK